MRKIIVGSVASLFVLISFSSQLVAEESTIYSSFSDSSLERVDGDVNTFSEDSTLRRGKKPKKFPGIFIPQAVARVQKIKQVGNVRCDTPAEFVFSADVQRQRGNRIAGTVSNIAVRGKGNSKKFRTKSSPLTLQGATRTIKFNGRITRGGNVLNVKLIETAALDRVTKCIFTSAATLVKQ